MARDSICDAVNQVLEALFALRCARCAIKIFLCNDIDRVLRPELRKLNILLLKYYLARTWIDDL